MKNERKKVKYVDDGRTVYSMDGLSDSKGRAKDKDAILLNRAEKRAAKRAAFETYLPMFFSVLACFTVVIILLYFWLR